MASDSKRALACVTMLLLLAIAGVIILVGKFVSLEEQVFCVKFNNIF